MVLDLVSVVLIVMVAVLGWRAGAMHTLMRIGAFAAAFFQCSAADSPLGFLSAD